jgi:hypothetical protein
MVRTDSETSTDSESTTRYFNLLVMPADPLQPSSGRYGYETDAGANAQGNYTYTPIGIEEITVPYGTFDALKVELDYDAGAAALWAAEGEGWVLTDTLHRIQ